MSGHARAATTRPSACSPLLVRRCGPDPLADRQPGRRIASPCTSLAQGSPYGNTPPSLLGKRLLGAHHSLRWHDLHLPRSDLSHDRTRVLCDGSGWFHGQCCHQVPDEAVRGGVELGRLERIVWTDLGFSLMLGPVASGVWGSMMMRTRKSSMTNGPLPMCAICRTAPVARRGRPYCSRSCAAEARRVDRPPCPQCGASSARASRRFCGAACWIAWREAHPETGHGAGQTRPGLSGASHPHWRGDAVGRSGALRRARLAYPDPQPCGICHRRVTIRVFRDRDPCNLSPGNVLWRCRECAARLHRRRSRHRRQGVAHPRHGTVIPAREVHIE